MPSRFVSLALAAFVGLLLPHAISAGELVNDTKETVAVQVGTRNPQTGFFTWSATVNLMPGKFVTIPKGQWYRHDSHVRDAKTTFTLPGAIEPNERRFYMFLYGNEVRIDVTRK